MEHQFDVDEVQHALALLHRLEAMRKAETDCDLIIKVEGKELPVHRNVMRANSDYIDVMLSHDTSENQTGVVEMKEVSYEPLKKLVNFFYTGKISSSLEKCEDLMYASTLMQVKPVGEKIATFLKSQLDATSFFKIKRIAVKYDLENLDETCDDFAVENLDMISKEEGFAQLEMKYLEFLVRSKKSSGPGHEDSKLALILQWVSFDIENRASCLAEIKNLLDFTQVSPDTLRHIVENEKQFHRFHDFIQMLMMTSYDNLNVTSQPLKVDFSDPQRPNAIIVFDLSSKCLQVYQPEYDCWTKMHSLIDELCGSQYYTSAVAGEFVYAVLPGKKVFCSNFMDCGSSWFQLKDSLMDHGSFVRCIFHKGFLYVAGENSFERFCPRQNKWEALPCENIICNCVGNTCYQNKIYFIGGREVVRRFSAVKDVHEFEPTSIEWSVMKSMHSERETPGVCTLNGKIYVAGGFYSRAIKEFECYDIGKNEWETLPPMNQNRSRFGLCVVGGKLYAVGHYKDPCTIETYDTERKCWKMLSETKLMEVMAGATFTAKFP